MYIYHHLGMGDHLICHGIVRRICSKFSTDNHCLCVKHEFLTPVSFMYKDIQNLRFKTFSNDHEIHTFLQTISNSQKLYIGHQHLGPIMDEGYNFDEAFYKQVGLSFENRWTNFKVERDHERELALLHKINPPTKYVFLHDDPRRGLSIDRSKIKNSNSSVVVPQVGVTNNIFDYLLLIEQAEEIHCMDSSFKLMIDSVLVDRSNLFYHVNLLNGARRPHTTVSKLSWQLI